MAAPRKAISMPTEIIIGLVVVLIVALALIIFTTGGITKSGKSTQTDQDYSSSGISCQSQAAAWCAKNEGAAKCLTTAGCDKCDADVPCGRI